MCNIIENIQMNNILVGFNMAKITWNVQNRMARMVVKKPASLIKRKRLIKDILRSNYKVCDTKLVGFIATLFGKCNILTTLNYINLIKVPLDNIYYI